MKPIVYYDNEKQELVAEGDLGGYTFIFEHNVPPNHEETLDALETHLSQNDMPHFLEALQILRVLTNQIRGLRCQP